MQFDPSTVKDEEFDLLPEGAYRVIVNGTALKANKTSDGSHVSVEFGVVDGQYKGRKLWHNFNVSHPNETAQKIGRAQMKKFQAAIGSSGVIDLASQLPGIAKNKMLYVDVVHEPDFRDKSKNREAIKHFDASREPSTVSKAIGAAHQTSAGPSKVDEIPF